MSYVLDVDGVKSHVYPVGASAVDYTVVVHPMFEVRRDHGDDCPPCTDDVAEWKGGYHHVPGEVESPGEGGIYL